MKDGILLELLTELFQAITANDGVTVTRRRVFTIGKGDVAEIDVLLEGRFGSSDMRVAVECRDRAQPQGKDWIQQIIGKRDDLRSTGIRHWVAVSSNGFTGPARALAERAGIELLVPVTVQPVDANAPGPHRLLSFVLTRNKWSFGEVHAELSHEDAGVLEGLRQAALNGGLAETIVEAEAGETPLTMFLIQRAEALEAKRQRSPAARPQSSLKVHVSDQKARLGEVRFTLVNVEVDAQPHPEVVKGTCKLVSFSDPKLFEFMGLIGVNTFTLDGEEVHLLVGFKPGYPGKLICHSRSSSGAPIPGWLIHLDEQQLQAAGFQSRPPKDAGGVLLHRLLKGQK